MMQPLLEAGEHLHCFIKRGEGGDTYPLYEQPDTIPHKTTRKG
jgi:hypothetical protein